MATKRDLLREVDRFIEKYCTGLPNKLAISQVVCFLPQKEGRVQN